MKLATALAAFTCLLAAAHAGPGRLSIFCWSEYIPRDVIQQFEKETGIRVSVENFASNEEMLAKLLAGGGRYDVIQPSDYVVEALARENLLEPLDLEKIPNLKNIAPRFLNMPFDPGNRFTVPFMLGSVGIVVNTEKIKTPIRGYRDVFHPEHKGLIVVVDDAREIVTMALETLGLPINDMSDENLAKARELLKDWLPLVRVFDSDSPKTAMLNGDAVLGVVWAGEAARLLNEDKKFAWVVPEEGAHLFADSLAIPKGARNIEAAHQFMNFILRPDISARISAEFPYLNPNLAARALLPPEALANPASFPPDAELDKMQFFRDIGPRASVIDELVTSLKLQ
ncbi:MAG: spermidine/putrescine ABC transporter substrate-binding protein [Terrimicrobiaceae bacterium]|nr:spermidine/putrescine ABC transporter substrate-binding protein [Terrimicrobiaceae bacterium]